MVAINFMNQILFLCPYLGLYLKRINSSRNCLLCCFKCKSLNKENPTSNHLRSNYHMVKQWSNATQKSELNDEIDGHQEIFHQQNNALKSEEKAKKSKKIGTSDTLSFKTSTHLINFFIFNKILRLIIFIFFLVYLIFNITTCTRIKVDLPVLQLIPEQSFLNKHMQLHQQHFILGPMVMIVFKTPLNYWQNDTKTKIRDLIDDITSLNDMTLLELNWIQNTERGHTNCNSVYDSKECFMQSVITNILSMEAYVNDVNTYEYNTKEGTETHLNSEYMKSKEQEIVRVNLDSTYSINSSRIYVQFKSFIGSQSELNTWHAINYLAYEKHNFTKENLIVFTTIQQVFEQMSEIKYEFFFITLITIDFIILIKFIYIFQLRFIYIHLVLVTSLFLSIISFLHLFQVQFNIISLLNFLIVPAIIIEYLSSIDYIYLHRKYNLKIIRPNGEACSLKIAEDEEEADEASTTSSERSSSISKNANNNNNHQKFELIKNIFIMNLNTNSSLIIILLASFLLMYNCSTYNFRVLFKVFLSILINLFLHINFFYPTLFVLFDKSEKEKRIEKTAVNDNVNRSIVNDKKKMNEL